MKSAGWYFKRGAEKVYVDTLETARRMAKAFADSSRKRSAVGYDPPAIVPKKAAARRRVPAKRNPVMRGVDYTGENWRIRALSPSGATFTGYEDTLTRAEAMAKLLRRQKYAAVSVAQVRKPNARRDNLVKLPKLVR